MKVSNSRRATKMGDQILKELNLMLLEEVQDPRLELVTLTGVRMNQNLRIAEIFFTTPGGEEERVIEALKAFKKASGFMRSSLGRRLHVKYLPEIRFTHDNFLEDMVYAKPAEDDSEDS